MTDNLRLLPPILPKFLARSELARWCMSKKWDWIDQSHLPWTTDGQPEGKFEVEAALAVACLQRIAESLETLVARSDPKTKQTEEFVQWANELWKPFKPYLDAVQEAKRKAINRLSQGAKKNEEIKRYIRRALRQGEPERPYKWESISAPIDHSVAAAWQTECEAFWDSCTELPERIAKDGTKKQARYAQWLQSLNHNQATAKDHNAKADQVSGVAR